MSIRNWQLGFFSENSGDRKRNHPIRASFFLAIHNQHIDFFLYMLYHDRKKAGAEK